MSGPAADGAVATTGAERRPIVGVMGSGVDAHPERSRAIGTWLGEAGFHLLTGGGRGVMWEVGRAFCAVSGRRGRSIGILPAGSARPPYGTPEGYPNAFVEIPLRTHLHERGSRGGRFESRNHLNVLSSDVIVALPGGAGTSSEVRLALDYGRPLVAWLRDRSEIESLPARAHVESDWQAVQRFVLDALDTGGSPRD